MAEEPMNELSLMGAGMKGMHLTLEKKAADAVQRLAEAVKTVILGAADEVVREAGNLQYALASRNTVRRACGALMERPGTIEEEAMRQMLVAALQAAGTSRGEPWIRYFGLE